MSDMIKIFKYQTRDVMRSRLVIFYLLFFSLFTSLLFYFNSETSGVIANILSINVSFMPLLTLLYGTTFYYNSKGYILFMLTQPVKRANLVTGIWLGVAVPLVLSQLIGIAVPFLILANLDAESLPAIAALLSSSFFITLIFLALAFFIAILQDDKAKGFGLSITIWFLLALLYDGFILGISVFFADYPLELPLLIISSFNPIDLARIFCLIHLDASALMGYTGAIFQDYFQSITGSVVSLTALTLWTLMPLSGALYKFKKKDF